MLATVPPPARPGLAPRRAPDLLRQQMHDLDIFLRSRAARTALEDAVSASYGGWRLGETRTPGVRTEARHAPVVEAGVDAEATAWPLHLRLYAVPALTLLPLDRAAALRL